MPQFATQRSHSADPDQCANCHIGVVDNNVPTPNIIDKTKHITGQVNVFGQEYPI